MITKQQVIDGLTTNNMSLRFAEWGLGHKGVVLFDNKGKTIEVVAMQPWHVDFNHLTLQFADKDQPTWFYEIFEAGSLSKQARSMLVEWCEGQEDVILSWFDGDETTKLQEWSKKI